MNKLSQPQRKTIPALHLAQREKRAGVGLLCLPPREARWCSVQSNKLNPFTNPFRPHLPSFLCSFALSCLISLIVNGFVELELLVEFVGVRSSFRGAHGGPPPITAQATAPANLNQLIQLNCSSFLSISSIHQR